MSVPDGRRPGGHAAPPDSEPRTEWQVAWERCDAERRARRAARPLLRSVGRGFRKRCPNCGQGALVVQYLRPTSACPACGTGFDHIRTDDFAPWLTILILGHLLLPAAITVERLWYPPLWVHFLLWVPIGVEMVIVALPRAKGAALGLMWSLGLRGDEHQY